MVGDCPGSLNEYKCVISRVQVCGWECFIVALSLELNCII